MRYGRIPGVERPASRIVMGSMAFRAGIELTTAILDDFVERGGNCVDTAYVYGTEAMVGEWLKLRGARDEIVLIAKGAHTPHCTPEGLTRQLHESLDKLGTDHADLYMLHRDNPEVPVGEFVECLNEHRRAGRFQAFGGSNWTTERIDEANAYAAARDLVGFAASSPNLALATWNEPMWRGCVSAGDPASREWYARTRLPLFAWSSQASGLFTGRFSPADRGNPAVAEVERTWFNDANFARLERVQALARERGVTTAEIALAWVLGQPIEVFALIGPRNVEETRNSLGALAVALTPGELRWLETGE